MSKWFYQATYRSLPYVKRNQYNRQSLRVRRGRTYQAASTRSTFCRRMRLRSTSARFKHLILKKGVQSSRYRVSVWVGYVIEPRYLRPLPTGQQFAFHRPLQEGLPRLWMWEVFDRLDDFQDSNDDETCVRIPVLGERGAFEAISGSPYIIMVRIERSQVGEISILTCIFR